MPRTRGSAGTGPGGPIGQSHQPRFPRDVPLLLAKHEGCLGRADEGFEDIAATFPRAETAICPETCTASPVFAEALRDFCSRLAFE